MRKKKMLYAYGTPKFQNGMVVNPKPGAVVDGRITYPNMFDFYIVSQDKSEVRHQNIY